MPCVSPEIGEILGRISSSAIKFLTPFLYFFTSCDKLATSFVSRVIVTANSAMDQVRLELVLTNSSNFVFPIVSAVARLLKQPYNSSILTGVPITPRVADPPARASITAPPNCSCPLAAWCFNIGCFYDFFVQLFPFAPRLIRSNLLLPFIVCCSELLGCYHCLRGDHD